MPSALGQTLVIAIGGAVGAVLRWWLSTAVYSVLGRGFPYGTLAVNALGSLLMGLMATLLLERSGLGPVWRAALLIGGLGAFTTFSTFSMETLTLLEQGEALRAVVNVLASVALCLLAAWGGVVLARTVWT